MKTLEDTGTWETVLHPTSHNIVGSKWVFQLKHKLDGSIDKYKAHLIAWGFTQIYETDYFEMYSPMAKLSTFRTILVLAVQQDWDINLFNFNSVTDAPLCIYFLKSLSLDMIRWHMIVR